NELKIFESALGQHNMITILNKSHNNTAISYNAITKKEGIATNEILQQILSWQDEETNYYSIQQKDLYEGEEYYIRLSGTVKEGKQDPTQHILDKIKKQFQLLGVLCNVNQGILSGIDKITNKHIESKLIDFKYKNHGVYVLNKNELNALGLSKEEKQIIKPFYKNSDIRKYFCHQKPSNFLIYATRDLDIKKYSNIYEHFKIFEKPIKARSQDRGEMQAALKLGKWWVIFAARNKEIFLSEKIICPQRSYENNFSYNEVEWFASADVYFVTPKDISIELKYVLSLLNSKLYYIWLYFRGKRKGEMLELLYTPLTEIPIKKIAKIEQKPFIALVDKILAITKDDDYLTNSTKQAKVKEYERQIDQMVYKLYGLTDEEIKIVEGQK
ncbi:MAG TPA: TaqI-like C-terminal specificity domain-containing protein, partial [bacterium]